MLVPVAAAVASLVLAGPAAASFIVGRNASAVTLDADGEGHALVTFVSEGQPQRVLVWDAVNARPPSRTTPQVEFRVNFSGPPRGTVHNSCKPVKLNLGWLVTACRAIDGSYWALQSWQRTLPNNGRPPTPAQAAFELRVSHWSGPPPSLVVNWGWAYHRFRQIFGLYTYDGSGVFGYRVLPTGQPLDTYGRNIYVDALDSDIGKGWKRVNSFLAHQPIGAFCYGFFPHGGHTGVGRQMRATAIGPGVTPDVFWQGTPPSAYSADADKQADAEMTSLLKGDKLCRPR